ncbi:glycoside hydrolase superfamily [Lipomyces starkeyi]|uniref:Glycosyl hydrolase family 13 catalytic domain-containing protein n=1 Tax=Lipomyces starkeyi NRRL Y-11557 TaxID=675824 RepID=A0A1E3PVE1_LIPST|nr:hypothetical protein LIPSTDRAFT_7052 [Lipomyces starkeyi NRRL Y-11557]
MRFWIIKGVNGFRLDVINFISKDPAFPDAPITVPSSKYQHAAMHYSLGPRLHEFVREIGALLKEYNAFSVGEMAYLYDPAEIIKIVSFDRNKLNMVFQFELIDIDRGPFHKYSPKKWTPRKFKDIVNKWQVFMQENDGWNALFLENHDWGRSVSRLLSGKDELRKVGAKMLATFIGLQSGTLFLYQVKSLVWLICRNYGQLKTAPPGQDIPGNLDIVMGEIQKKARDHARLPFQWDGSDYAGFSSVQPWMDENEDYKERNAAVQVDDPSSVFSYWRSILDLRRTYKDVLVYGKFELVDPTNEKIYYSAVNVQGTRNVLDAETAVGSVKALDFTSSSDVLKGDSWQDLMGG